MIEKSFRYARWFKVLILGLGILAIAALSLGYQSGNPTARGVFLCFLVFFVVGALDVFMSRVELHTDELLMITLIRKRRIPRSEIESVKREGGSVFLKLTNGQWLKVPELGHNAQSVANSFRVWIKRGTGEDG